MTKLKELLKEKIKKVDGKYVLYPKSGGKRLGTHRSKEAAEDQEQAIQISKHGRSGKELDEGGMGILNKDQTDVLHAIVMRNKNKNSNSILKIALKDRMFKGIDRRELLGYIDGARQFVRYMGRTGTEITEAKYKETYKSITARNKDYDRIFGPIGGHPRVRVSSWSEVEKTGRMKTAYIEISGDKIWVDAYKKIAFKGNGRKGDVIKFVRKETGNSNEGMIKLKELINENSPGFDKRKFGDSLPTFKDVMEKHQIKERQQLNELPFSSPEAQQILNQDIKKMSKILGKSSQQIIKIMMDGVKSGKYDAMDIPRGINIGPLNRTHEGERPFMKMLWRKVRDGFRRYSKNKKLRR